MLTLEGVIDRLLYEESRRDPTSLLCSIVTVRIEYDDNEALRSPQHRAETGAASRTAVHSPASPPSHLHPHPRPALKPQTSRTYGVHCHRCGVAECSKTSAHRRRKSKRRRHLQRQPTKARWWTTQTVRRRMTGSFDVRPSFST